MNILAFDLGASGGRMLLCSCENKKISFHEIHRFEHCPIEIGGGLYWDIIHIFHEMNTAIEKAVRLTDDHIDALGIDAFCNDFACVSHNGDLLTPVRCYRDARTKAYESQIYERFSPKKLYDITGNQRSLFSAFMQMSAMTLANQRYILSGADKILFVPDLLINFLTGKFITEYTLASVSQLYSYEKSDWDDELLSFLGLKRQQFGEITRPGTVVGYTKPELNKRWHSKGFKIIAVCAHDTASAFLSAAASRHSAIISSGTWALVGTETDAVFINEEGFEKNIANEGSLPGHHRLIKNVMGTWILQEVLRELNRHGLHIDFSDLEASAQGTKPFQWLIDVDDRRFYSPGNMIEKIRAFCTEHAVSGRPLAPSSVGEIVRCVYESLSIKYRLALLHLESVTGRKFSDIHIVGGGSKSALQCQLTADICGLPVISGPADAAGLGNMLVQLTALGAFKTVEEAQRCSAACFKQITYMPRCDYTQKMAQYSDFIQKLDSHAKNLP